MEIDNKIGELTYIAIGQGKVELSPIQACSFIACIANGGKLSNLIVDEIWDSLENNMLFKHENYFRGDLGISSKVMAIIHRGMFDVIHGSQASAK